MADLTPLTELARRVDAMMCQCGHELGWHVGTNGVGLGSGPACHCGCDHFVRAVEAGRVEETRAVGVPEVTIESGQGKYGAGLWHVRVNGKSVSVYEAKSNAESACRVLRSAFEAAGMPRPSAAGEVERGGDAYVTCEVCKRDDIYVHARSEYKSSRYWIRACARCHDVMRARLYDAESLCNAALAAGLAETDRLREMFTETRRRMCRAFGVDDGKSWSWLESRALDGLRVANEKIWLEDTLADALAVGLAAADQAREELREARQMLSHHAELTRIESGLADVTKMIIDTAVAAARAEEREADARECDELRRSHFGDADHAWSVLECARRIRARGALQTEKGKDNGGQAAVASGASQGQTIGGRDSEVGRDARTEERHASHSVEAHYVRGRCGKDSPIERAQQTPGKTSGGYASSSSADASRAAEGQDSRASTHQMAVAQTGHESASASSRAEAPVVPGITPAACPRCDGHGMHDPRHSDEFCRACNGTGRAPAAAPHALTGAQLAERYGFEPHGRDPLTGGVARDALGVPLGAGGAPAADPPGEDGDTESRCRGHAQGLARKLPFMAPEVIEGALYERLMHVAHAERARARREALRDALSLVSAQHQDHHSVQTGLALSSLAAKISEMLRVARALVGETKGGG